MKVSDFIASFLAENGITHVFELVGGMIAHLTDSIGSQNRIRQICMHHEQAAAFAAEGWSRISGKPGVALASSGPGAINLLTGIGSCYFDSVPAIFITGQVNTDEQRGNLPIRQLGFQETDIVPMALPITKWARKVEDKCEIPSILRESFFASLNGRPGPVLLDIPMNIQRFEIEYEEIKVESLFNNYTGVINFHKMIELLRDCSKPLIIAGGGIRNCKRIEDFFELVNLCQIPVVHSLMGVDVLPYSNSMRFGLIGTYGNRWANLALHECDLLIVLGSRLDVRQTGADILDFTKNKRIIRVDIDSGELRNRVVPDLEYNNHLDHWISSFMKEIKGSNLKFEGKWKSWELKIVSWRREYPDIRENPGLSGINPNQFIHVLSKKSKMAAVFCVDVGNHQMWASQSIELNENQRYLTSGGMGSMGYSLPAAIGAFFASGKPVISISGDGGFQVNIQELQTVANHKIPIKMVIMNNHSLGMIKQFQETYFESRFHSSIWGYSTPDFVKVAKAYGIDGFRIDREEDVADGLARLWENPELPFLLEVNIDTEVKAHPKMQFGKSLSQMEPEL